MFKHSASGREAYLRMKWGRNDSAEWVAILGDDVSETTENPKGNLMVRFDTYNQRLEGNDPNSTLLPGVYGFNLHFDKTEGNLYDKPLVISNPFPDGSIFYRWARAQSPISNASSTRLNPHLVYVALVKKEILTSKSEEIGFKAFLWETKDDVDSLQLFPSEADWGKATFHPYTVPETPWAGLALLGTVGAAALATRKMSRRSFLLAQPNTYASSHMGVRVL